MGVVRLRRSLDESPPNWGHVWGLVSHSEWLPPPWWATWELRWTPAPPGWGEAVLFDSKATSRLVTDMWGDGDGSSRGQCPKVLQVQSPQAWVLAPLCWSLGPGTLGPNSWVCLALVPLTERPRWLGGTPPGDPSIHGVSWTGAGLTSDSSGALPVLQLISPDRVPHGHGPAQRGQHLVPVCGAHSTGTRPNDNVAHVVPAAVAAVLSHRHSEGQILAGENVKVVGTAEGLLGCWAQLDIPRSPAWLPEASPLICLISHPDTPFKH